MKKQFFKKVIPIAVLSTVLVASWSGAITNSSAQANEAELNNNAEIKNVIFLIGDGMGVSYTSAYRYLKDDPTTPFFEKTVFDKYLVGQQMTYPDDLKQSITDSASAATAMSAGVKTYNAAIAVDKNKSDVKTVLEAAKETGKSTGLVATSEITHATPAAFGAHNENRKRSYTGWTTGGHTGEDVPVYVFGPSKERFAGLLDNTDHAKIIFDILNAGKKK